MEPWIGADECHIAPAGAMDVARLATWHLSHRCQHIWPLSCSLQLTCSKRAELFIRCHDDQAAARCTKVGTPMQPERVALPSGAARQEIIQAKMTEFMSAVG